MIIESNIKTVVDRQIAYNVYDPAQFVNSPYMDAYWSGHLIEELCEFLDCALDEELSEAADVIIFLQNLTAYIYPTETLKIDLEQFTEKYDHDIYAEEIISAIRKYLPNRKTWKSYPVITFANWYNLVSLLMTVISQNYWYKDIEKAYLAKQKYNKTREDWN